MATVEQLRANPNMPHLDPVFHSWMKKQWGDEKAKKFDALLDSYGDGAAQAEAWRQIYLGRKDEFEPVQQKRSALKAKIAGYMENADRLTKGLGGVTADGDRHRGAGNIKALDDVTEDSLYEQRRKEEEKRVFGKDMGPLNFLGATPSQKYFSDLRAGTATEFLPWHVKHEDILPERLQEDLMHAQHTVQTGRPTGIFAEQGGVQAAKDFIAKHEKAVKMAKGAGTAERVGLEIAATRHVPLPGALAKVGTGWKGGGGMMAREGFRAGAKNAAEELAAQAVIQGTPVLSGDKSLGEGAKEAAKNIAIAGAAGTLFGAYGGKKLAKGLDLKPGELPPEEFLKYTAPGKYPKAVIKKKSMFKRLKDAKAAEAEGVIFDKDPVFQEVEDLVGVEKLKGQWGRFTKWLSGDAADAGDGTANEIRDIITPTIRADEKIDEAVEGFGKNVRDALYGGSKISDADTERVARILGFKDPDSLQAKRLVRGALKGDIDPNAMPQEVRQGFEEAGGKVKEALKGELDFSTAPVRPKSGLAKESPTPRDQEGIAEGFGDAREKVRGVIGWKSMRGGPVSAMPRGSAELIAGVGGTAISGEEASVYRQRAGGARQQAAIANEGGNAEEAQRLYAEAQDLDDKAALWKWAGYGSAALALYGGAKLTGLTVNKDALKRGVRAGVKGKVPDAAIVPNNAAENVRRAMSGEIDYEKARKSGEMAGVRKPTPGTGAERETNLAQTMGNAKFVEDPRVKAALSGNNQEDLSTIYKQKVRKTVMDESMARISRNVGNATNLDGTVMSAPDALAKEVSRVISEPFDADSVADTLNLGGLIDIQLSAMKETGNRAGYEELSEISLRMYDDIYSKGIAAGQGINMFAHVSRMDVPQFALFTRRRLGRIATKLGLEGDEAAEFVAKNSEDVMEDVAPILRQVHDGLETVKYKAANGKEYEVTAEQGIGMAMTRLEAAVAENSSPWEVGMQKASLIQTMSQLLNVRTALRNLVGNVAFQSFEKHITNPLASLIDAGMASSTGKRSIMENMGPGGFLASASDDLKVWREGLSREADNIFHGIDRMFSDVGDAATRYDIPKQTIFREGADKSAVHNALAKLEKGLNYILRAPDAASYGVQFKNSMARQMLAKHGPEWSKFAPDENIIAEATRDALRATFQDNTALARGLTRMKQGMNIGTTGSKHFGLGDLLLKYPKTPANILMRASEYMPGSSIGHIVSALKGGSQKRIAEAFARAIVGGAGFATFYWAGKEGFASINKEENAKLRQLDMEQHQSPYTLNVGKMKRAFPWSKNKSREDEDNDLLMTFDWMQPASIIAAAGIAAGEKGADAKKVNDGVLSWIGSIAKGAKDATIASSQTLADQPLMRGIEQFGQSMAYNNGDIGAAVVDAVLAAPGSFTPSLIRQMTYALADATARDLNDERWWIEGWKRFAANTPLRGQVAPARRGIKGQEITYSVDTSPFFSGDRATWRKKFTSVFNSMVNPSNLSRVKKDPVYEMMHSIYDVTGDTGHIPYVSNSYSNPFIKGENMKLTPKEKEDMQMFVGATMSPTLEVWSRSQSFRAMPADEQAKAIRRLYIAYLEKAKEGVAMRRIMEARGE